MRKECETCIYHGTIDGMTCCDYWQKTDRTALRFING